MEKEYQLLNRILELREKTKCTKFIGAITTELIRNELISEKLNISNRDVFIESVPYEIDLLVLKKGSKPLENIVYRANDVLVAFEIKFRGAYSREAISNVQRTFKHIKDVNKNIKCIYLMFSENVNYKYWTEEKKLGDRSFLLLERSTGLESAMKRNILKSTGDWNKFIEFIKTISK